MVFDLLAMAAIFLSVISSFFTQNKEEGAPPFLDPPLVWMDDNTDFPECP